MIMGSPQADERGQTTIPACFVRCIVGRLKTGTYMYETRWMPERFAQSSDSDS